MVGTYGPGHDAEASFERGSKTAGRAYRRLASHGRSTNTILRLSCSAPRDAAPDGIYLVPEARTASAGEGFWSRRGIDPTKVRIMGRRAHD